MQHPFSAANGPTKFTGVGIAGAEEERKGMEFFAVEHASRSVFWSYVDESWVRYNEGLLESCVCLYSRIRACVHFDRAWIAVTSSSSCSAELSMQWIRFSAFDPIQGFGSNRIRFDKSVHESYVHACVSACACVCGDVFMPVCLVVFGGEWEGILAC